jgi:Holliday junction resolvase RusA-like endonuclease
VKEYLAAVSKKKSKPAPALDLDALTKQAHDALTEHGFVKLSAIKPKQARDAVVSQLVALRAHAQQSAGPAGGSIS